MVKRKDECSVQKRMFRDILIIVIVLVALFLLARAIGFI
jgi:flagellar basal body-associated protein FliL